MTDYRVYRLNAWQIWLSRAAGFACGYAALWLLYRQPVVALAGAAAGWLAPRWLRRKLQRSRTERMRTQFKEALRVLSSLLGAGRSVENAIFAWEEELRLLIADPRSDLLREIRIVAVRCQNGETPDAALSDFAARSGIEEVRHFAEAFVICKRSGGDLVEVIRRASSLIGEKMEVEMEVSVLLAQKRLESRLMMGMPFAFVGLLGFAAPDYMAALHQGAGWAILTVGLLLLAGCCFWMRRLMEIRL